MLRWLDRFFSILPLFIIAYHVFGVLVSSIHLEILGNIVFTYAQGTVLKHLFKKDRCKKSYEFKPFVFASRFPGVKSHYGFPSCHTMFYFQYFMLLPSASTLAVFICGALCRIFYEHHTRSEVLFGCIAVLATKALFAVITAFCAAAARN